MTNASFDENKDGDVVHIWSQWLKSLQTMQLFGFQHLKGQMGAIAWYYFLDIGCLEQCASMLSGGIIQKFQDAILHF